MGFWTDNYGLNGRGIAAVFIGILLLTSISIGTPFLCCSSCEGAKGNHTAYVIAVSDMDFITWDSTIVWVKTDPQASNEDTYCVTNSMIREKLEKAAKTKERVTIHFHNGLPMWRWECNGGDSIIIDVEPIDEQLLPEEGR